MAKLSPTFIIFAIILLQKTQFVKYNAPVFGAGKEDAMLNTAIPRLLTVKQITELTGWSKATAYRYIDAGRLRVIQTEKRGVLRVDETEVLRLLNRFTQRRGVLKSKYYLNAREKQAAK